MSKTYELVKFKTGLDWESYFNFEDPDELFYRDANLQALYQRSIMKDKLKLRQICKTRNPVLNMDARNFDLEKVIEMKNDLFEFTDLSKSSSWKSIQFIT